MTALSHLPSSDLDPFADDVLANPYPHHQELRNAGPLVYLRHWDVWALPRCAEMRAVLEDWQTFSSGKGVGLTEEGNRLYAGKLIASDPPRHDVLRKVLANRLAPRAIRQLAGDIERRADEFVSALVSRKHFDAVTELAQPFPISVVADLVGLPEDGRDRLLSFGDASFNAFGPANERTASAFPLIEELFTEVPGDGRWARSARAGEHGYGGLRGGRPRGDRA